MAGQARRKIPVMLIVSAVLGFAAMAAGGAALQKLSYPPGIVVGGSLGGGVPYLVPCIAGIMYVIVAVSLICSRTGFHRSIDVGRAMLSGRWGLITGAVVICCAGPCLLGSQATWRAGEDGVMLHAPWPMQSHFYGWADATTRKMYCIRERRQTRTVFKVTFKDGRTIDLTYNLFGGQLESKLPVLVSLTEGVAHSIVGRIGDCAPRVMALFARRTSPTGQFAR